MDLGISGRMAVVTGASRGIGAATVALLEAEGARVIGVSRELLGDRGADAARGAGDQCASLRSPIHAPHWITPAPQVKPAPNAASTTFMPGSSMPRSRASASAIGRVADDVFP